MLGRSLHGAYCIAQSTEQKASSPGPGRAWRGGFCKCHEMINAMKAPPQGLRRSLYGAYCIAQSTEQEHHEASSPGPGRDWTGGFRKCHEMVNSIKAPPQALPGPGRSLHGAYCIAQSTQQENHDANSPGPSRAWRVCFMLSLEWPGSQGARPLPCDL